MTAPDLAPNAGRFDPASPEVLERWSRFGRWDRAYFPNLVGLVLEEVRTDYARLRLPFRAELEQPAGVVHGGAIATLIDTAVVPAVGQAYPAGYAYLTIQMDVRYRSGIVAQDAVAEGWVEQRGRTLVFCRAEVRAADGTVAADGTLVYTVRPPR